MNSLLRVLLIFSVYANKASTLENPIVKIAVVEYRPILNISLTQDERILANTQEYIRLLEETSNNTTLDMIVFPEDTLRNTPKTAIETNLEDTPCNSPNYPKFVQKLSCASINFSTYIIVNLVEKIRCNDTQKASPNCKNFGFFFYNTDIVFDRLGRIVSKYHKYNLFGEYELDKPSIPEKITFDTDFGVKFGIFTCFDILFKTPAQDILTEKVDAVVFPTMWFSELPFLTALQTQQMWAHAHNIKLFASGANNPALGSGGSGIYNGRDGSILTGIEASGGSRVHLFRFVAGESPNFNPQEPEPYQNPDILGAEMDQFKLSQDPSVLRFNSTILETSIEEFSDKLCYDGGPKNQLCCQFNIKMTYRNDSSDPDSNSYVYRLVAFSGVRSFDHVYNGGIEVCGIVACLNSSIVSCGLRFANYDSIKWPITFEKIEIKANFEKNENKTQFPNSLLSSIRPINASQTIWTEKEVRTSDGEIVVERSFSIREPQDRLLTFAIYGRNFEQDSPPEDDDGGSLRNFVNYALLAVNIILGIFVMK